MYASHDFVITKHLRERFVERFSKESVEFAHLRACKQISCETCRELTFSLCELVEQNRKNWDSIICAKMHDAKNVKIFQNDFTFMDTMYKKYGYDRYDFLVEGNILFVVKGNHVGVTCCNAQNPLNGSMVIANYINRPKYKKAN
jgi:hypothetical protein